MLTSSRKVRPSKRTERNEAQTLAERAKRYLERMPAAISGQGGHGATFAVAVALVHGFGLSAAEAWPILCEYNTRCQPPWSEMELRHKLESAEKLTRHPKPRGHLLGGEDTPRHFSLPREPERAPWVVRPEPFPKREQRDQSAPEPDDATVADPCRSAAHSWELVALQRDRAIQGQKTPVSMHTLFTLLAEPTSVVRTGGVHWVEAS
jgi:hypothetical protein